MFCGIWEERFASDSERDGSHRHRQGVFTELTLLELQNSPYFPVFLGCGEFCFIRVPDWRITDVFSCLGAGIVARATSGTLLRERLMARPLAGSGCDVWLFGCVAVC